MTLSPELQRFIAAHVESVTALESLLLFHAAARPRSDAEVAEALGVDVGQARSVLHALAESGVLATAESDYLLPADPEATRRIVSELAREYSVHRIEVLNAIYSVNLQRLRAFAEAFKLRKP